MSYNMVLFTTNLVKLNLEASLEYYQIQNLH